MSKPGRLPKLRALFWVVFLPISCIWALATFLRRSFYPRKRAFRSRLPVLCVGNIHSGGSGKTPLVLEIARRLEKYRPAIVSRGYRGRLSGVGAHVDPQSQDGPRLYGDEPWMLSRLLSLPVFIDKLRARGIQAVEARGDRSLVILDDGFQHLKVARDVDLVAINSSRDWTESFCLPLGDLREPIGSLRAASAVVLVGGTENDIKRWRTLSHSVAPEVPIFEAVIRVEGLWHGSGSARLSSSDKLGGFCGIAAPLRFFDSLSQCGPSVSLWQFPDHHLYKKEDVSRLLELGAQKGVQHFVTTEKDWGKAAPLFLAAGVELLYLRIRCELSAEFWYFLGQKLERA